MSRVKIAVIGLGHLGSHHLRIYLEHYSSLVEVVAVCDTDPQKIATARARYPIPAYTHYELLPDLVDAVDICTPTQSHFNIAAFFLKHGKHAFIEKPITNNVEEADILIDLAQQKNLKLQIGHVERFNAAFEAIAPIANNPLFIECHRLNQFPNRSLDIGVVEDLMIHDIDIILGLIDAPLKNIDAVGVNVLTDLEDIANARLTFTNGCVCNLTASRISDEIMRKIRIFLPDTYISLDYIKQEAFLYKKYGSHIQKTSLPIEKEEPLKKELENFILSIKNNMTPLVSGMDGRNALHVAQQISQKIWEKQNILSL